MHSAIRSWQRGLARHLAKRLGEEEDWRGEEGGEEGEEGEATPIKSGNRHLAGEETNLRYKAAPEKTDITTTNDRMSTNAYNDSSYSIKSNSLHFDFIWELLIIEV